MISSEIWHHLGLQDSTKHFMCTLLDEIELIRNLGHRSWARHRIWLGQVNKFRNSYKVEPQYRRPQRRHTDRCQAATAAGCRKTRRARTTRNEPGHEDRCQATPAAVRTDLCAPGSEPSPCRLHNSRRPDGRVCARRVPSHCLLRTAALRTDECAPGGYPAPAGYE